MKPFVRMLVTMSLLCGCGGGGTGAKVTPPIAAVTAAGEPIDTPTITTVGAAGGTVRSGDGNVELVIPAGALSTDTALSITALSATAPGGIRAYRLGPEGTTFSASAGMRFLFGDADIAGSAASALRIATQDAQGHWQSIAATIDANGITAQTTHLSDWSLLLGWQIRPAAATVQPGKTLNLSVRFCGAVAMGELVTLVAECQADDELAPLLGSWAVNGVARGNAALGTVVPGSPTAIYTAPAAAPSPSTVAVSVELTPPPGAGQKTLLVSNVTVAGGLPKTYAGTLTYHLKLGGPSTSLLPYEIRVKAQVTLARSGTSSSYAVTDGTATLLQIDKDTDASCHCTASNIAGTVDELSMVLDSEDGVVSDLQWNALFTVPLTCTPASCQTQPAPEFTAWALTGMNPVCTNASQTTFADPRKLAGSWSTSCPVNPQLVGRVEESAWMLQASD